MSNIWSALLSGLIWFINALIMPLFGNSSSQAASMNLAQMMASNAGVMFQLVYITLGSVVNLALFAAYLSMVLVVKGVQIVTSIYMFIKSLIPAA